jgi:L,D-transpeptidase ErfK/SrfK
VLLSVFAVAKAENYVLPPDGIDVIGTVSTITAAADDTLVELARAHGLGYFDIVRANPGVDPWLPGAGTDIVLPKRFVLPPGPRSGIVLNLAEYRMYYFPEPKADEPRIVQTFPVSIGRMDWATPLGLARVVAKSVKPTWYPPQSIRDEHAADGRPLPPVVPPGPDNPLGDFAMRLSLPGYLIHGTNRPAGVGMRVTHGCVRMFPEDIEYLFPQVAVDTPVRIINEPIKLGWDGDTLVMEAHPLLESAPVESEDGEGPVEAVETVLPKEPLTLVTERFVAATDGRQARLDWNEVERLLRVANGIPKSVGGVLPPVVHPVGNSAN